MRELNDAQGLDMPKERRGLSLSLSVSRPISLSLSLSLSLSPPPPFSLALSIPPNLSVSLPPPPFSLALSIPPNLSVSLPPPPFSLALSIPPNLSVSLPPPPFLSRSQYTAQSLCLSPPPPLSLSLSVYRPISLSLSPPPFLSRSQYTAQSLCLSPPPPPFSLALSISPNLSVSLPPSFLSRSQYLAQSVSLSLSPLSLSLFCFKSFTSLCLPLIFVPPMSDQTNRASCPSPLGVSGFDGIFYIDIERTSRWSKFCNITNYPQSSILGEHNSQFVLMLKAVSLFTLHVFAFYIPIVLLTQSVLDLHLICLTKARSRPKTLVSKLADLDLS